MTDTSELLGKVKQNLILEHTADDTLLERYIIAAVSYAESYQHLPPPCQTELSASQIAGAGLSFPSVR